jgi:hypothetical protein
MDRGPGFVPNQTWSIQKLQISQVNFFLDIKLRKILNTGGSLDFRYDIRLQTIVKKELTNVNFRVQP